MRIPVALLAAVPANATAAYVAGDVRYTRPEQAKASALQAGTKLPQGTTIEVALDGFVRLEMADGSVVRIPGGSRIRLASVQHQETTHRDRTIIEVEAGRVDASVRHRRNNATQFEIHTPLAIASVRGTEFGVAMHDDAVVTSEVMQGIVYLRGKRQGKVRHGAHSSQQLLAGQGARVDDAGSIGPVRAVPAAPDLSKLPSTLTDADFVRLQLPATPRVVAYRVRISTDAALEQVVRDGLTHDGRVQYPGLDDGTYTVGVRAEDDAGLLGVESRRALRVKARPVPPLVERPAPDERLVGNAVELVCTQPAGVQAFRLQIATEETFQSPEVDDSALTDCRRQATLPPGRHFWRVASVRLAADGTSDQGPYSGIQHFELVAPPPEAPTPAVTGDEESLQIHWDGLPGLRYLVQVAHDSAFAHLVYNETQAESHLRLPDQIPGTYHVRIQAIDATGESGAFSSDQVVQIGGVIRDSSGSVVRDAQGQPVGRQ